MSAPSGLSPEVIRRAQQSDPQALSAIYERYAADIYRYIYFRVNDHELARDLQSDVFVRMLEGIDRYEDRGWSISSWLYRIAHDRMIDVLRRRERMPMVSLDTWVEQIEDPRDNEIEVSAQRAGLERALSQINPIQAQVLRLRYIYDLSIAETARQMGRSEGSIKSLQYRAQQSLGRVLEQMDREATHRGEGFSFA
ncbi:RNA polymerase sigma factor [Candidatus Oscillochloris fontis]|uniref:RNA polymerase sigma factor n=1 Tax=Candidatus Oscillochloris fontis TaxID=2496868 RepID=UPI00101DE6C7|nr:RNA polymerase sigma factor [Candidatus Oscillochloris fontis]